MPPDFYKMIDDFRKENREDHGKIFDKLDTKVDREEFKAHLNEHKEARKTILSLLVKVSPWLISAMCLAAAFAQKAGVRLP